jgi:hypothetical protein
MSGKYDLWHRFVYRFILGVYFARVSVIHRNRLPRSQDASPRGMVCLRYGHYASNLATSRTR